MKFITVKNREEGGRAAAEIVAEVIREKPDAVLGLATGSSPEGMYESLCRMHKENGLSFSEVRSVNLDEYVGLSKENDQSYNYYMWHNLFSKVNIRPENVNLPNGLARDTEEECARYNKIIAELGAPDLQVLGIGHNGHIGFNEPSDSFPELTHTVELSESTIEANSRFFSSVDEVPRKAITMGIGQIRSAKKILLLAFGKDKAEVLKRALFGEITSACPASALQTCNDVTVVADEEAMSLILPMI